jgi:hypothetical protein
VILAPARPATAWPLTPAGSRYDGASLLPDGRRLDDAVAAEPDRLLGPAVHARTGPRLPFALPVTPDPAGAGVLRVRLDAAPTCLTAEGPALVLCTEGAVRLTVAGEPLLLLPGRAAFVPAGLPVCAAGPGVVVRATA